jgi:ComF family protein
LFPLATIKSSFQDLLSIAYPNNCKLCRQSLFENEETLCSACLEGLPTTNYLTVKDNPIQQLFWGRCEIEHAAAMYFINKHNKVHDLMHLLKYRDKPAVGERLGRRLGNALLDTNSLFDKIDYLVPVPLHWKKEKLRGYNQSYHVALGVKEKANIPIDHTNLERRVENISQTKKGKYERWENVEEIFVLKNPALFKDKHLLLIDDVVTTGATLEACVHALKNAACKVSIFTLATAGA